MPSKRTLQEDVDVKDDDGELDSVASGSGSGSDGESDDSENLDAVQPVRRSQPSEGTSKSYRKYAPPPGLERIRVSAPGPFSFDSLSTLASKPGVQLWAVRVPADFKPERLAGLSVKPTPTPSGSLTYKSTTYALRAVPTRRAGRGVEKMADSAAREAGKQAAAGGLVDALVRDEADDEGGEEMDGLKLLVPEGSSGKLVLAPMPISHRLVLVPTLPPASDPLDLSSLAEPSPAEASTTGAKRKQPSDKFKFRNHAYGFDTPGPGSVAGAAFLADDGDEGAPAMSASLQETTPQKKAKGKHGDGADKAGGEKKKKRKSEAGETPKKRKKVKE